VRQMFRRIVVARERGRNGSRFAPHSACCVACGDGVG
jgi:hypothetical protein